MYFARLNSWFVGKLQPEHDNMNSAAIDVRSFYLYGTDLCCITKARDAKEIARRIVTRICAAKDSVHAWLRVTQTYRLEHPYCQPCISLRSSEFRSPCLKLEQEQNSESTSVE